MTTPVAAQLLKYERGALTQPETVRLFAELVRSHKIEELPVTYLSVARRMIVARQISPSGVVLGRI